MDISEDRRRFNLIERCALQVGAMGRVQFETLADVGDWNRSFPQNSITAQDVILRRKAIDDSRAFVINGGI